MSEGVAERYLEDLKDQIVVVAVDYRFWFTYFCNSVEQNKASAGAEDKLRWQRDIEESERYVKDTRKKLFDLIESYNAEMKGKAALEKEPEGG